VSDADDTDATAGERSLPRTGQLLRNENLHLKPGSGNRDYF
jgi:hypothetical protein